MAKKNPTPYCVLIDRVQLIYPQFPATIIKSKRKRFSFNRNFICFNVIFLHEYEKTCFITLSHNMATPSNILIRKTDQKVNPSYPAPHK